MDNIIQVRNLKKYFPKVKAVDDISFDVKEGELFGFLGVNGAGKSTSISIMCTLTKPTDGKVTIAGYDLSKHSKEIRKNIGVVFQENTLDDKLTVKENLILRGCLYEKSSKKIKENLSIVSTVLDIEELLDRQFIKLSGGQKRRCEIAKSLMNIPKVLFLDEPTTGLDPKTRQQVWESIEQMRKDMGMTVFLTTHYMEEAAKAQHICVIDSGKIVATGTPSELKKNYTTDMLKLYTTDLQSLAVLLNDMAIEYKIMSNHILICLKSTKCSMEILKHICDKVDAFEVLQGNMDDAFINIAGKTLGGQNDNI